MRRRDFVESHPSIRRKRRIAERAGVPKREEPEVDDPKLQLSEGIKSTTLIGPKETPGGD